jgi:hypothetical protein
MLGPLARPCKRLCIDAAGLFFTLNVHAVAQETFRSPSMLTQEDAVALVTISRWSVVWQSSHVFESIDFQALT